MYRGELYRSLPVSQAKTKEKGKRKKEKGKRPRAKFLPRKRKNYHEQAARAVRLSMSFASLCVHRICEKGERKKDKVAVPRSGRPNAECRRLGQHSITLDDIAEGAPDLVLQRDAAVIPPTRAVSARSRLFPFSFFTIRFRSGLHKFGFVQKHKGKRSLAKGERTSKSGKNA